MVAVRAMAGLPRAYDSQSVAQAYHPLQSHTSYGTMAAYRTRQYPIGKIQKETPMKVALAYGRGRPMIDVPDHAAVIAPQLLPGLADERAAFDAAVRAPIGTAPLRELPKPTDTVAIVIADITRPSPTER